MFTKSNLISMVVTVGAIFVAYLAIQAYENNKAAKVEETVK